MPVVIFKLIPMGGTTDTLDNWRVFAVAEGRSKDVATMNDAGVSTTYSSGLIEHREEKTNTNLGSVVQGPVKP